MKNRDERPDPRRGIPSGASGPGRPRDYARRDFLRAGATFGVAVAAAPLVGCSEEPTAGSSAGPAASAPAAPRRVELGRTGVEVPDIGFGTFALESNVDLVRFALDRGITHFDTAESYTDGRAEEVLGRAFEGDRDRVTLTTKVSARSDATEDSLMEQLEGSLRRLRTDYVDFYLNHAVDSPDRMSNPGWNEFVARAKAQGKIRYSGMSGHGPSLVPCLEAALESDQLDVILVGYNYIQSPDFLDTAQVWLQRRLGRVDWVALQPDLPRFLERARAAGVGVMAMKTLRGARHNDMRPFEGRGATFSQAALRWVLSDPRVDSAVITMTSRAAVDEYLAASGGARPTGADVALLGRYEQLNRDSQCIQGCGACAKTCPSEVPISDVLRIGMYDRDYGQPAIARRAYASLERNAEACVGCSGAPCAVVCPTGVAIRPLSLSAHARLAQRSSSRDDASA